MPAQAQLEPQSKVKRRNGRTLERAGDHETAKQLSCSECRRVKVRCNRQWPCQSCVRRGCASICPNGTLAPGGPGNRYILHGSEELHQKLITMSERIKRFEDLARDQWNGSAGGRRGDHPMLKPELLKIKELPDTQNAQLLRKPDESDDIESPKSAGTQSGSTQQPNGPLASEEAGASTRSEPLSSAEMDETVDSRDSSVIPDSATDAATTEQCLSDEIKRMAESSAFSTLSGCKVTVDTLLEHLPLVARAWSLCETFFEHARLCRSLLPPDYVKYIFLAFYRPPGAEGTVPYHVTCTSAGERSPGAHELAILFAVFAIGEAADLTQHPSQNLSQRYDTLAKAALRLESPFQEGTIAFIQAVQLMLHFRSQWDQRVVDREETWLLFGAAVRTALNLGLHRENAIWGITEAEAQTRRSVFWHLYCIDGWNSLGSGRPPQLNSRHIDCKIPEQVNVTGANGIAANGSLSYTKNSWVRDCMRPVVEIAFSVEPIPFDTVLELDRSIRDFDLRDFEYNLGDSPTTGAIIEKYTYLSIREWILLHVHRTFFNHVLSNTPEKPFESPFAVSVIQSLKSAVTLLQLVRECYQKAPALTARFGLPWTFLITSAAVTGCICNRGPRSIAAPVAFAHLRTIVELFESSLAHSPRNSRFLPIVYRLQCQANAAIQSVGPGPASALTPTCGLLAMISGDDSEYSTSYAGVSRVGRTSPTAGLQSLDSELQGLLYPTASDGLMPELPYPTSTDHTSSWNAANSLSHTIHGDMNYAPYVGDDPFLRTSLPPRTQDFITLPSDW